MNPAHIMMKSPPGVCISRHRFDDFAAFDAFVEAMTGWQLCFCQLDHGRFMAEVELVVAGSVMVIRCRFNRRLEQVGSAPPGCRTFGVTQPDHVAFRWRNYEIQAGDLMSFAEDIGMDCQSAPGFHLFAVSICEPLLEKVGRLTGMDSNYKALLQREGVVRPLDPAMRELRQLCQRAIDFSSQGPASEQVLLEELASEFPRLLMECFRAGEKKLPMLPSLGRRRALRRAMEVIREAPEPIQTVSALCELTGESARMLAYAFRDSFGMSPKAYLQVRRLNAVRHDLLRSAPETLVAEVANRQGFWHMGQFAADYRKLFGELPSATLRRARGAG